MSLTFIRLRYLQFPLNLKGGENPSKPALNPKHGLLRKSSRILTLDFELKSRSSMLTTY